MQAGTYFPKVGKMLLCLLHSLLPLSLLETDPQNLERSGCADEVQLGQIYPSEGLWSRNFTLRAISFVHFTRWIGFFMSKLFRKIDFGGCMS